MSESTTVERIGHVEMGSIISHGGRDLLVESKRRLRRVPEEDACAYGLEPGADLTVWRVTCRQVTQADLDAAAADRKAQEAMRLWWARRDRAVDAAESAVTDQENVVVGQDAILPGGAVLVASIAGGWRCLYTCGNDELWCAQDGGIQQGTRWRLAGIRAAELICELRASRHPTAV